MTIHQDRIAKVETLACSAGWRNYYFVKITTSDGVIGWSEYDEGFGNPGITNVIHQVAPRFVGERVGDHERVHAILRGVTRPGTGGVVGQALGAIENALLDAKAKILGVPCAQLLGGVMRDRVPVYWSHCGTWRISRKPWYEPMIDSIDGVVALGREVRERGFRALKTNVYRYEDGRPIGWATGFGVPFEPGLNVDRKVLRGICDHLDALREGAGPDVEILLDLNFNAKTEGYLEILRAIAGQELFWVELDTFDAAALAYIRDHSAHPIASCETLVGLGQFMPFLRGQAVDVAIVDLVWNGAWQAMKIAALADAHEVNVAPHNFYGHLATMMNLHFAAAVPNLRIMETDIDRIAWDEQLFTHAPEFEDGCMVVPDRPGWGTEPDEEALRAHPANDLLNPIGLITYGRRSAP
ncbi:MAG: mandelate racemase/muconate lactonizing enzyme family protein [Novosphingobium sp.]|jgi:galactonate dehydratase|nr:mandelate racemase/muconate lactonizing enzyme family protein [Novosphingobium sp.]